MHDLQPRARPTNPRNPRTAADRASADRSASSRSSQGASVRSLSSAPSGSSRPVSDTVSNRARSTDARSAGTRSAGARSAGSRSTGSGSARGGRHGGGGSASGSFDRRPLFIVAAAATLLCGLFALTSGGKDDAGKIAAAAVPETAASVVDAAASNAAAGNAVAGDASAAAATGAATGGAVTDVSADPELALGADVSVTPAGEVPDLDGSDLTSTDSCLMDVLSVRIGDTGQSVSCVQQALKDGGYFTGTVSGTFDDGTYAAARAMQADRDLFVDGVIGRESALSLGVWPDEESFVTRTPPPPAGAVDLMGYPLSSVASAGSNAPALPPNSGSGRRLVYDRAGQRLWAVGADGSIIRSWLVSGSKYSNELPGTHEVYSRSEMSTAWNGKAYLPKMVRWLKTDIGAIGFHSIPLHVNDGSAYQTEAELGTRLSGGCQRQAVRDANFVWDFAQVGTPVIVV